MKSLSKQDIARRDNLVEEARKALEAVQDARLAFNEKVVAFNETVEAINSFAEDISNEIESYIDEKSEKWQEGDRGTAYCDWRDEWQGIEIEIMDEMDSLDESSLDAITDAATEPSL